MRNSAASLVRRKVVMGDGGARRSLIRCAVNTEHRSEAMQLIGVVGQQVSPFEATPLPDRRVNVNRHGVPAAPWPRHYRGASAAAPH